MGAAEARLTPPSMLTRIASACALASTLAALAGCALPTTIPAGTGLARIEHRVSLPISSTVESLNVAVATGILLYQLRT